jgi:SAM-dependent methyltransferase
MESEIRARDKAYSKPVSADHYDIERLPELDAITRLLGPCEGQIVLDAGCGRGQMVTAAAGARVYCGIDFARQGLEAFPALAGKLGTVALSHGDVCRLPYRANVFDKALSSQVLEHIPSEEGRLRFLAELARVLKPGAPAVITVYNWHEGRRAKGVAKEGIHASGIFYHCYEVEEFNAQLRRFFRVDVLWGAGILLPFTFRFTRGLGGFVTYWDRLWRSSALAQRYGELLVARCSVP